MRDVIQVKQISKQMAEVDQNSWRNIIHGLYVAVIFLYKSQQYGYKDLDLVML